MSDYSDILLEEEDRNEESLADDDVQSITKSSANAVLNGGNFELFSRSKRTVSYLPSANEPLTVGSKRNIPWKNNIIETIKMPFHPLDQKRQLSRFKAIDMENPENESSGSSSVFDFFVKLFYFLLTIILIGKLFFASND